MKNHYKTSGFTLIELVITVAIIAVVSAIAIPAYNGYIETARMTEAKNNIAALKLAEEEFFLENNTYFHNNSDNNNGNLETNSQGLWKATGGEGGAINFNYSVSSSSTSFSIIATGKSGTRVAGKTESYP